MISHQTKGTSFRGLQNYLFAGKTGVEVDPDRVAYVETFNLGEIRDPAIVARLMRATAAQNFRVEKPVLHLSINPPPEAKLSREELRQVAVNVLHEVGLSEHQALLVVHHDLDRQHAHLMVNRIHPETLLAWKRDFDYKVVNAALDREAARLGLRRVQREKPGLSKKAYWKAQRRQKEPFVDFLRPKVEEGIVAATSWNELSAALAKEGLYLRKRGQGLVVTDGAENAKLSALSDLGGLGKFEKEYGERFTEYAARVGELRPDGAKALRDLESDLPDPRTLVSGVLEKVTQHDAVFTVDQVRRHAFWAAGGKNLTDLVLGAPEVLELGVEAQRVDSKGHRTDYQTIYTTHENWRLEGRLAELVEQIVSSSKEGSTPAIEAPTLADSRLSEEQKAAVTTILENPRLAILSGPAGAGKGWVLGEVRQAYEEAGYVVRGMAPSGIAAAQLRDQGLEARTIAAYEHQWNRGRGHLTDRDVVVLDEVSMVSTRQMVAILEEAERSGSRLVIAGDAFQLSPVGAGDPYRVLLEEVGERLPAGVAQLSRVYRQEQDWHRKAADQVRAGDAEPAIRAYAEHDRVRWAVQHRELLPQLTAQVIADQLRNPGESQLALAVRRKDVELLNRAIRFERKRTGHLGEEVRVGERTLAVGDRVVFLRNDPLGRHVQAVDPDTSERGVQRGDFGTIRALEKSGKITVDLDAGREVAFDPAGYRDFDLGYAATVHRAQGASIDRVYYVPSRGLSKSAAYTALSRHRKDLHLFLSKETWIPGGARNPDRNAAVHLEPRVEGLSAAKKSEALQSLEWFMRRENKIDMAHQRAAALERRSPGYGTTLADEAAARNREDVLESGPLAQVVPIRPELDADTLERVEALRDTLMSQSAVFVAADVERFRIEADLSKGEAVSLYSLPDVIPVRDDSLDGTMYTTRSYLERETAVLGVLEDLRSADRLHLIDGPTAQRTSRLQEYVSSALDSGHTVEVLAVSRRRADELALAFDRVEGVEVRTTAAAAAQEPSSRHASLLVLDEASRLSTERFGEVLPRVQAREAFLVLSGEADGAKPLEAGDPYRGLVDDLPGAERLGRQGRDTWSAWDRDAFEALQRGDAAEAVNEWAGVRRLGWAASRAEALTEAATETASDLARYPEAVAMTLAYRRSDAEALSREVRAQLVERGIVNGEGIEISGKTYAAGDRVVVRETLYHSGDALTQVAGPKNDARKPIVAGSRAVVQSVSADSVTLRFELGRTVALSLTSARLDHAYSATVARAPDVDRAHLVLDRFMDRDALLHGVSRHSTDLRLYGDRETFTSAAQLAHQLEATTPRDLARDHVVLDRARATLHGVRQERSALAPPAAEARGLQDLVASKLPDSALGFDEHLQRIVHTRELVHALRDDLLAAYKDPQAAESSIARAAFEQGPAAVAEILRETPEKFGEVVGKEARAALPPATVESLETYGLQSEKAEDLLGKLVSRRERLEKVIAEGKRPRTLLMLRASIQHTENKLARLQIAPRSREARVVRREISMLERGIEKLSAADGSDIPDRLQALRDRLGAHAAIHRAAHTLDHLARVAPKNELWNSLRQGTLEKPGLLRQAAVAARGTHLAFHQVASAVRAIKSTRERSLHEAASEAAKRFAKAAAWGMLAKAAPVAVYVSVAVVRTGYRALQKLRDRGLEKGREAEL